ncbi:MAG TPA: hypothetical protein VFH47_04145 [Candidatus Thermoplasmatota archaeon]|nr:hypothetical protein [Candidatus Thermoplasmatota archaeon]
MPERADPVRNTIDTLRVDPSAREDRPYLETMLRRLGYSESEIRQALGDPAPAAAAPEETPMQTLDGERVIEIEYTGPGLREFLIVEPADETEFAMEGDPHGLGAGLTAGEEVLGGGPSMEEVDALVAQASEDEWNDWGDEPGGPSTQEGADDIPESNIGGDEPNPFEEGAPGEGGEALAEGDAGGEGPAEGEVEFGGDAGDGVQLDETYQVGEEIEFIQGHELVEFESLPLNRGRVLAPGEATPALQEGATDRADAAAWADASAAEGASGEGGWPAEAGEVPFRHEEWALYTREVELADGRPQKVYFFSRGEPKNGEPAGMPEGYEVAVNERTGLPYLRRVQPDDAPRSAGGAGDGPGEGGIGPAPEGPHPSELDQLAPGAQPSAQGPPRKRVRMVRVKGASREEAERKVLESGKDRNVIRSVPIDIKGGGGDVA